MSSALQVLNENNKVSEWAGRITECRNSGLSVREWCEANHLCTQTYYRWQKRLFELAKAQQEIQFAEVTPVRPVPSGNVAVTVRIAGAEADISDLLSRWCSCVPQEIAALQNNFI